MLFICPIRIIKVHPKPNSSVKQLSHILFIYYKSTALLYPTGEPFFMSTPPYAYDSSLNIVNYYIKQFSVFVNRSRYSATALLHKSPSGPFFVESIKIYMCTIVNSVLPCRNLFCHQISLS